MTPIEWTLLVAIAAQTSGVLALMWKSNDAVKQWARDVFAAKHELSALEAKVTQVDMRLREVFQILLEIKAHVENSSK